MGACLETARKHVPNCPLGARSVVATRNPPHKFSPSHSRSGSLEASKRLLHVDAIQNPGEDSDHRLCCVGTGIHFRGCRGINTQRCLELTRFLGRCLGALSFLTADLPEPLGVLTLRTFLESSRFEGGHIAFISTKHISQFARPLLATVVSCTRLRISGRGYSLHIVVILALVVHCAKPPLDFKARLPKSSAESTRTAKFGEGMQPGAVEWEMLRRQARAEERA